MQIEIIRPRRNAFDSFTGSVQSEIEGARESIFYRWPTPHVPVEGKQEWDEDIAQLWAQYGGPVVLESIAWHRQNTDRRPHIPQIKERCAVIRETQGRRNSKDSPAACEPYGSVAAYDRAVAEHLANPQDDKFVPFELLYRDAAEFQRVKMRALAAGEQISRAEIREWWLWRTEETDAEWAKIRQQMRERPKPQHRHNLDSLELADILNSIR